jgi:hypothetical protein
MEARRPRHVINTLIRGTQNRPGRILTYAQEIGWGCVSRADVEARRDFDPDGATREERARLASLYFDDLLHAQILAFNAKYKEAEGALVGELRRLSANIAGNREFLSAVKKTTSVWPTRLKNIMQG